MKIDREKKEVAGWWFWILMLLMVSGGIVSILSYAGKFTSTVVERKVFENSYQYSEARKAELVIWQAQLAEITRTLSSDELSASERSDLKSQAAAIRIQIAAAKAKQ